MNIINMLLSYLAPDQTQVHIDPTHYTPLMTVDAHRGNPVSMQPAARAAILSQFNPFLHDSDALLRAFKDLMDAGNEIKNLEIESNRVIHLKGEFDRVNELLKMARRKYVEIEYTYRNVKVNCIDLLTAFREYNDSPRLLTRDILSAVTLRTEEEIIKIERALKDIINANSDLGIEPIIEVPLVVGAYSNGDLISIDDVHKLFSRLQTTQDKYLQAHSQLQFKYHATASLQTNAASRSRYTPLEAVFQLIQYGRDVLSDYQVQQMIVSSVTNVAAAAIAAKFGIFSQNSTTTNVLEAPYTSRNSTNITFN